MIFYLKNTLSQDTLNTDYENLSFVSEPRPLSNVENIFLQRAGFSTVCGLRFWIGLRRATLRYSREASSGSMPIQKK